MVTGWLASGSPRWFLAVLVPLLGWIVVRPPARLDRAALAAAVRGNAPPGVGLAADWLSAGAGPA